jgi:solute carrier family 50 protein (sugar transporter)
VESRGEAGWCAVEGMSSAGSLFFPVLGVVLSNLLYFSPWAAVRSAAKTGHLGSLNVLPQALMVASTQAWMCYALAVPNGFIVASNLPGAIAAMYFVTTTLPLMPREPHAKRHQVQAVLVGATTAMLTLWTVLVFKAVSHETIVFVLGAYGSAICVLLFASPLSTVADVISTRNAASIYAPLTGAQCTNCLMWTVYGLAIGDVWVYGPNGTGLVLGLLQLVLKIVYPSVPARSTDNMPLFRKENFSDEENAA